MNAASIFFLVALSALVVLGLYSLFRIWRRSQFTVPLAGADLVERRRYPDRVGRLRRSELRELKRRGLLDHALLIRLYGIRREEGFPAMRLELDRVFNTARSAGRRRWWMIFAG